MRIKYTLYYFLFLLIITGAFASMAQNDYGLRMIAWTCYSFGGLMILELLVSWKKLSIMTKGEHISLFFLFILFALRASYIHFPYLEWAVVIVALSLIIVYSKSAFDAYRRYAVANLEFARVITLFYSAVIFFMASLFIRPLVPGLSDILGGIGGAVMGIFAILVIRKQQHLVEGSEIRVMRFVRKTGDHASVLLTGFFCMSIFVGLNMIGLLPPLYTQKVPKEYIKLVNDAEMGREEPIDGKFQHDVYKEELELFLERHGLEKK